MKDHVFIPGDALYGRELQCSVIVPTQECGKLVSTHCGYPPEDHPKVTDPKHSNYCELYLTDTYCNCWVSRSYFKDLELIKALRDFGIADKHLEKTIKFIEKRAEEFAKVKIEEYDKLNKENHND